MLFVILLSFFFFQAEDGIRDRDVTGVQTVLFRSSTRSFTDDLAPGLSTKDRAHWDRGLDPGPERQHARYCQGPKARSHTIDRTEHQVHRRFQAGFRLRGVQS